MGAADRAQMRPGAVTIPLARLLTCLSAGDQAPCPAVCSVRDEEAAGSNPIWNQSGEWTLAAARLGIGAICDEGTQIGPSDWL
jgi:hypothetical protein